MKAVVFGAGLVSKPGIKYLMDKGIEVTVATRTVEKAEKIVDGEKLGKAVKFDISKDDLEKSGLIQGHDIAVSLLPYEYHPVIAEACIKHKKHMATASYVSEAMRKLDGAAKDTGVVIVNECGVDPGIDHMSAMKIFDEIKEKKGKILSFKSITGGLPAPKDNDNPFGYKFSWSPRGVLLAGRNAAQYLEEGEVKEIKSGDLFNHHWNYTVEGMELEAYPNRDSNQYIDFYDIPGVKTMFRGTFRYRGWCETIQTLFDLGLMDLEEKKIAGITWRKLMKDLVGASENVEADVAKKVNIGVDSEIIKRMTWLGLFEEKVVPESPTYLDALSSQFQDRLGMFKEGEQDMIVMQHEFIWEDVNGKKEKRISTMVDYGIPHGDSSMARTVSLPLAIAVRMIVESKIQTPGVLVPTAKEVYEPILEELENLKITFKEEAIAL